MIDFNVVVLQMLHALREGHIQHADDIGSTAVASQAAEQAAASGVTPPPPIPRRPSEVLYLLLTAIVAHLGNKQELAALLEELRPEMSGLN